MTQEEKQLLLKDLCARLPYEVKVYYDNEIYYLNEINPACKNIDYISVLIQDEKRNVCAIQVLIEDIKPYLRPMSSQTEEERKTLNNILKFQYYSDDSCMCEASDWLNEHHFDYRGLIEKGVALAAPENMYKEK